MKSFDEVWSNLQTNLKVGTKIKNWTAYRGYLGDVMTIAGVRENYIEIDAPKAHNIQIAPKDEFERVWEMWADYKSQKVKRHEFHAITRCSKYIISILHWCESA